MSSTHLKQLRQKEYEHRDATAPCIEKIRTVKTPTLCRNQGCGPGRIPCSFGWLELEPRTFRPKPEPEILVSLPPSWFVRQASCTNNKWFSVFTFQWTKSFCNRSQDLL